MSRPSSGWECARCETEYFDPPSGKCSRRRVDGSECGGAIIRPRYRSPGRGYHRYPVRYHDPRYDQSPDRETRREDFGYPVRYLSPSRDRSRPRYQGREYERYDTVHTGDPRSSQGYGSNFNHQRETAAERTARLELELKASFREEEKERQAATRREYSSEAAIRSRRVDDYLDTMLLEGQRNVQQASAESQTRAFNALTPVLGGTPDAHMVHPTTSSSGIAPASTRSAVAPTEPAAMRGQQVSNTLTIPTKSHSGGYRIRHENRGDFSRDYGHVGREGSRGAFSPPQAARMSDVRGKSANVDTDKSGQASKYTDGRWCLVHHLPYGLTSVCVRDPKWLEMFRGGFVWQDKVGQHHSKLLKESDTGVTTHACFMSVLLWHYDQAASEMRHFVIARDHRLNALRDDMKQRIDAESLRHWDKLIWTANYLSMNTAKNWVHALRESARIFVIEPLTSNTGDEELRNTKGSDQQSKKDFRVEQAKKKRDNALDTAMYLHSTQERYFDFNNNAGPDWRKSMASVTDSLVAKKNAISEQLQEFQQRSELLQNDVSVYRAFTAVIGCVLNRSAQPSKYGTYLIETPDLDTVFEGLLPADIDNDVGEAGKNAPGESTDECTVYDTRI